MKAKQKVRRVSAQPYVIGVDIGGTFTDIVASGGRSTPVAVAKVLTDYEDLARGVANGISEILKAHAIPAGSVTRVVHGTTLVTNSLIERRGCRTALIVTEGFADVLELGRESRYDIYDIELDVPAPLVPREAIFEAAERIDHQGAVVRALSDDALDRVVDQVIDGKFESVAVCLLHSYANTAHEQRIGKRLAARLPGVSVSLSSDVMPDLREYERTSTTVANAYVKPVVKGYLERLRGALVDLGMKCELSIITSDGGVVDADTAMTFPVRLTESGPAGGATAASYLGRLAKTPDMIAYDMGGTTAKICVIENSKPLKSNSFEFGRVYRFAKGSGLPLQIPVVEMIEIGAGGGSIAHVNAMGMLQIGPHSANAAPGPACYALGGDKPTVTDADLVLGYLGADSFLGGTMKLDIGEARAAIERHVARPLRMDVMEAAYSIHRVVNANMARAAKVHCLEHGKDPRAFSLFAYGGAGPVHAYGVAQLLGVKEIMFSPRAGVMSAIGFLVADPSFEVVQGRIEPLEDANLPELNRMLARMEHDAGAVVRRSVPGAKRLAVTREAAVRFEGQSYELYVPIPAGRLTGGGLKKIAAGFNAAYAARYHAAVELNELELVRWRVRVTASDGRSTPCLAMPDSGGRSALRGKRPVYVPEAGKVQSCAVYDRYALRPGSAITGPAVVEEPESTVYIGPGSRAVTTKEGDLRVTVSSAGGAKAARRAK